MASVRPRSARGSTPANLAVLGSSPDLPHAPIPILLGEGTALAPKLGCDVPLVLADHRAFESGLVQLRYRVKR